MIRRLSMSAVVCVAFLTGCAKQPVTTQTSAPAPTGPAVSTASPAATAPASPSRATAAPPATPRAGSSSTRPAPADFVHVSDVADVHFDFDKHEIRPGDVAILEANARWLHIRADHIVLIEGHCDDRGTSEYNVALGERRARAAMNYLVSRGIRSDRITLVSYGEDRPACTDKTESCWTRNRRAHFKVKRR
jgi:peptidoglycan-associated lipoprotein